MKNVIAIFVLILVPALAIAQNKAVDKLFNKYQGKDGFTTVLVNQEMFKLISSMKTEEGDIPEPLENITGVKILVQEEEEGMAGINFYDELKADMDFSAYVELVVVKEKDQDVWIIAKEKNGSMEELLVIVGGEENVLVWIQGEFTFEQLAELGKLDGLDHLNLLNFDKDCDHE
ncbi:MAG: DUF4252 domain-containing protein [Bacteroidales bacterium]|nr:DUF4252 domain-containing protein [Bacteroidales bacterium]